ncbi:hypothetical protein QUF70_15630 [Desulfobacterales bacterium HSG17]|nr:hypothetical protein [Desulfobacterales bacterium HSG17]
MSVPGKTIVILFFILCCTSLVHASDISDSFTQKFNSMIPAESSSVQSDYLYEQIALGSQYTILMLDQLTTGNENLNYKTDVMIEKFDILIEQNKKIIELLQKTKDSGS